MDAAYGSVWATVISICRSEGQSLSNQTAIDKMVPHNAYDDSKKEFNSSIGVGAFGDVSYKTAWLFKHKLLEVIFQERFHGAYQTT